MHCAAHGDLASVFFSVHGRVRGKLSTFNLRQIGIAEFPLCMHL